MEGDGGKVLSSLLVSDIPDKCLFRQAAGLVDNMTEDGDLGGVGSAGERGGREEVKTQEQRLLR